MQYLYTHKEKKNHAITITLCNLRKWLLGERKFQINGYKEALWIMKIVLEFGVKAFGKETFSFTNMKCGLIQSHAKKSAKHEAYLKSYLSQNVLINPLMTDSTDANAICSESNSVAIKQLQKILNGCCQLSMKI